MNWGEQASYLRGRIAALEEVRDWIGRQGPTTRVKVAEHLLQMASAAAETLRVADSGPKTSAAAARSMTIRAGTLRHDVLKVLAEKGPMTDEEVGTAVVHPRIWPRCSELRRMGLIKPTGGVREVRRTGAMAEVCEITPEGRTVLAGLEQGK